MRIIDYMNNQKKEYAHVADSTLDLNVTYEVVDGNGYSTDELLEDLKGEQSSLTEAAIRKGQPLATGVLAYFPDALKKVAECSVQGQKQHNVGEELYWDKNKSSDNADALVRHLADHYVNPIDDDGTLHLAKVAWRALATLQIYLDNLKH